MQSHIKHILRVNEVYMVLVLIHKSENNAITSKNGLVCVHHHHIKQNQKKSFYDSVCVFFRCSWIFIFDFKKKNLSQHSPT